MTATFASPLAIVARIGEIVEGDEAVRYVTAGYAVEIDGEPAEKPVIPVAKKKTTRTKPVASETR